MSTSTDTPVDSRPIGLRALLPYLREHRGTLVVVGVLSLAGSAASLAQPLLTRSVLDRIGREHPVWWLVAVLVGLVVLGAAIGGLRDYLLQRTAEGLVLGTRRRLAAHLLRLPIAEYDQRRIGDLLSRVGSDTTLLRAVVTSGLFEVVTGAVMVVGAGTAMVLLDPLLFGVTLLGVGLGLGFAATFARRVRALARAAQERVGEMTSAVERAISAARTIRASRAEAREADTVAVSAREAYGAGLRVARVQALIGPIGSVTVQGAFLLVLGIGGARVAAGAISVGDLVAFVMYLFLLALPLGQVLRAYTQLQSGLGALQRIEEILDVPAEGAADRPTAGPATTTPRRPAPMIEFDRVGFGYPGGASVLHDVSFAVPTGTRTALVGPSGAGKSTLLALVERFYEVSAGAVRVDGVDVRELPRDALRARLGYVEQEAPVLAGTLRENLLITAPDATDDRLREVLDEVNLTHLAQRAPQGLDVQVGEGGVLLSGVSGSGWPSGGPCWPARRCCCSTSRPATSTRATRPRCAAPSTRWPCAVRC
ncbi:ABC transporter ATP-binding protein [Micromonospora sp. CA-246542]|uniref:ABC transporter ATP-binding protein n=1 Tax=Micromonospora sp. CA-246542 TaxID=3239959 RepID=UPI003D8F0908